MSDNKLPKDWKQVKLSDAGKIISGGTPSTVVSEYWNGNISWISPSDLTGYKNKTIKKGAKSITEIGLKNSSTRLMPKGSVLFSSRAPIGYVAIADNELCTNQGFKSIIPNENVDSDFIYYYLKASKQRAEQVASGTTFKEISLKSFSELAFPLPPLSTQQTIVSKIEELFSELDNGISNLKTAQLQLKTYRQSVLKWAFEGRFTSPSPRGEGWGEVKDGELPKGWEWKTIKELTTLLGDGLHGTPKYDEKGNCYFINGNNLSNGKIEIKENTKKISEAEYLKHKKLLNERTVLVSINGTLGNVAFYNNEKVVLGKSACYFNLINELDKFFVKYIINSQRFINYAINSATGSTIPNVSLKSMREFTIPFPSLIEQKRIVQEIETRLSVADKIEESIIQSLQQAEALRQSILKKAFEGKLV